MISFTCDFVGLIQNEFGKKIDRGNDIHLS